MAGTLPVGADTLLTQCFFFVDIQVSEKGELTIQYAAGVGIIIAILRIISFQGRRLRVFNERDRAYSNGVNVFSNYFLFYVPHSSLC
jgi:hypothetical protein